MTNEIVKSPLVGTMENFGRMAVLNELLDLKSQIEEKMKEVPIKGDETDYFCQKASNDAYNSCIELIYNKVEQLKNNKK